MKHVTGKVDLSRWNLESYDVAMHQCREILLTQAERAAGEALECLIRENDTFNFFCGLANEGDPLKVEVIFELANPAKKDLIFEWNLGTMLLKNAEQCKDDGDEMPACFRNVAVALRDLADKLEKMVEGRP